MSDMHFHFMTLLTLKSSLNLERLTPKSNVIQDYINLSKQELKCKQSLGNSKQAIFNLLPFCKGWSNFAQTCLYRSVIISVDKLWLSNEWGGPYLNKNINLFCFLSLLRIEEKS